MKSIKFIQKVETTTPSIFLKFRSFAFSLANIAFYVFIFSNLQSCSMVAPEKKTRFNPRSTVDTKYASTVDYLLIIDGHGLVTKSKYPSMLPPYTTKSKIDRGSYDPRIRQIKFDIGGRLMEVNLEDSLTNNKQIKFTAKYAGHLYRRDTLLTIFPSILAGVWFRENFQTQGYLIKRNNLVQGQFTRIGKFGFWGGSHIPSDIPETGEASISGQFAFKLQSGKQSDLIGEPIKNPPQGKRPKRG